MPPGSVVFAQKVNVCGYLNHPVVRHATVHSDTVSGKASCVSAAD